MIGAVRLRILNLTSKSLIGALGSRWNFIIIFTAEPSWELISLDIVNKRGHSQRTLTLSPAEVITPVSPSRYQSRDSF